MEIDRRAFLASVGGLAAIEALDPEAKAEALEHFMMEKLDEEAALLVGGEAQVAAAPPDATIRRGAGSLFGPSGPPENRKMRQLAPMSDKPTVLFVCVHNAGRSQMAAGYLKALGGDRVEVLSAGSEPKDQINPVAVQAMAEEGIDIAGNTPKLLTVDAVQESDVVITMGCGDACPIFPGKRYEDWELDDPAGQGIEAVRPIRDQVRKHVEQLLDEILPRAERE